MDGSPKYLGQGSQFIVHKATMMQSKRRTYSRLVAVKQPKFELNPDEALSMADIDAQKQLYDLLLEIRALAVPSLLAHPNIARILYWSWNSSLVHAPMNLVMELASSDLANYIEARGKGMSMSQKNSLCSDVAQGLDAIHQCQLVHGDLKPANILIFEGEDPVATAKLADFGLSVEELEPGGTGIRLGGTEGWQAPEVVDGLPLPREKLHKTDNFSFGLVIWSIFLGSGKPPLLSDMSDQYDKVELKFKKDLEERENDGFGSPKAMIYKLLSRDPACRPGILSDLFDNETPKGALLPSDNRVLDLLLHLSRKGSNIAKALVLNVLEFYGRETPPDILPRISDWLSDAVEGGSILARSDLERVDPTALAGSLQALRDRGGYSNLYTWDYDCPDLHATIINGALTDLRNFLCSHDNYNIEERTTSNETPLYLACARGEMDIIVEMINRGASAVATCTEFGISCLHWVFTFTEPFLTSAIIKLKEAGADIDAMTGEPVPFPHYPFVLPAGTALHWAIATRSHAAARALIEQGASLSIRNGSDPYKYDRRVRVQECAGLDQEAYSEPERPTQGLSPLDCAAMQLDPFVFETLLSLGKPVDINATDEEGFTVLHHTSSGHIYHTREGGKFSVLPFQGSPMTRDQDLRCTIAAIKSLGGDMEKLTTPWTSYHGWPVESRTALMLAVEGGHPDIVGTLLDAGACPDTKNNVGKTAMFYLSEENDVDFESVKLLVSAGADVTHRENRKGATALLQAAYCNNLDLVDLLLSSGADISERVPGNTRFRRHASIFGLLPKEGARESQEQILSYDQRVARILEDHLFTVSNADQLHRIMEHDVGGRTLLYRFSEAAFPCTVSTLLRHGAHVGPQAECCLYRDPEARPLKSEETPLSAARNYKKHLEELHKLGQTTKVLSEYRAQLSRMETVIKLLVDAGWA
ncbi:hypothetical protein F4808DRAFT_467201 [Astrocystis sublimbata]|nr:hypothetical protein F4808DRAFT_467201 [Astrocystis sublimbata]